MSIERQRFAAETQATAAARADAELERPPRRSTVIIGIAGASALFLFVVGFLLYRSITHPVPTHVVTVVGSEAWLGAELTLRGEALPHPYEAVIERAGRYSVPFFVGPGTYELTVRMNGAEMYRQSFDLRATKPMYLDLPKTVPSTQPATTAPSS